MIETPIQTQSEIWTDIRCPACVRLGYDSSRLLLRITGATEPTEARLQVKCHRCKSVVEWVIGTPFTFVKVEGESRKPRKVAFE